MPIMDMQFEHGVFSAREMGHIDKADAELWFHMLRYYTENSREPVTALVDALDVTFISSAARRIFAFASHLPNLNGISVATRDPVMMQTARMIGMLGEQGRTHVFATLDAAHAFAYQHQSH